MYLRQDSNQEICGWERAPNPLKGDADGNHSALGAPCFFQAAVVHVIRGQRVWKSWEWIGIFRRSLHVECENSLLQALADWNSRSAGTKASTPSLFGLTNTGPQLCYSVLKVVRAVRVCHCPSPVYYFQTWREEIH